MKKILMLILKIVIAALAMIFIVKNVNYREIYHAFSHPQNWIFIILAVLLVLPNLYLHWFRWHYLVKLIHPSVRWFSTVSSYFGGLVIGFVTPGRIGEFGRSIFLNDVDKLQATAMVFIDKLYAALPVFTGGMWGMILLFTYHYGYAPFILWPLVMVGLIFTMIALLIGLNPRWIRNLFYQLSLLFPRRDKLKRFIASLDHFQKPQAKPILFISILLYVIYTGQFCLLALAFEKITLSTAVTATTATLFAKTLLPISFADLGIREGASIYFFLKFNVAKVTAFNSALLLFTINVLFPTLLGLFFVVTNRSNKKKCNKSVTNKTFTDDSSSNL